MKKIMILILIIVVIIGAGYAVKKGKLFWSKEEVKKVEPMIRPISGITVSVDLSGKGLKEVPSDTFSKTDTESLNLSNNELSGAISSDIKNLQALKVLNLSNNQLTGIPAEIGSLSNLESLDISNNKITGLPQELGNLSKLKYLNLSGNDYTKSDLSVIKSRLPLFTVVRVK